MSALLLFAVAASQLCVAPRAIDGDTIRCGGEHVRLVVIDAPELPGHCRRGRVCVPGDGYASKRALARILARGPVTLQRCGFDRYGRTLARVSIAGRDAGAAMIATGAAVARYSDPCR